MIRTLVEQVHAELKDRILSGRWRLGSRVFEEEVALELGVSRGPVREAIRLLEQEGLLLRHPHRGLFVPNLSAEEVMQVASLGGLLEAYAVRWGRPVTRALVDELEAITVRMDAASREDDRLAAVVADREFHGRIVALCDNRVLQRKFHELDGHVAIFFHSVLEHMPDGIVGLGDRHRLVVAALAGGDVDEIDRAIQAHYQDAARRLPVHMSATRS